MTWCPDKRAVNNGSTVEVEGPSGVGLVDARPSDALSLLALVFAPVFVTPEVLAEAQARSEGDSPICEMPWSQRSGSGSFSLDRSFAYCSTTCRADSWARTDHGRVGPGGRLG